MAWIIQLKNKNYALHTRNAYYTEKQFVKLNLQNSMEKDRPCYHQNEAKEQLQMNADVTKSPLQDTDGCSVMERSQLT